MQALPKLLIIAVSASGWPRLRHAQAGSEEAHAGSGQLRLDPGQLTALGTQALLRPTQLRLRVLGYCSGRLRYCSGRLRLISQSSGAAQVREEEVEILHGQIGVWYSLFLTPIP